MALSDSWLKANHKKPRDSTLEKADAGGLGIRVSAGGRIVFQYRYRFLGKPARLDLGTYPLMSLKEARTEHLRLKALLEQGVDPRVRRKVEKSNASGVPTNRSLYMMWHEGYSLGNYQDAEAYLRSFEIHVFPTLGDLPVDETTGGQWMAVLGGVKAKAPSIAERILNTSKQVHLWAYKRGLINSQPLALLNTRDDLQIEDSGDAGRALAEEEIRLVWHCAGTAPTLRRNTLFIRLCLFFGCRNGELRDVNPLEDLDFEAMTWTIPVAKNKVRKKVKRDHVRPLIPEVVPMLQELMGISRSKSLLMTGALKPVRMANGTVISLPGMVMHEAERSYGVKMKHWSMHDLRKTARTNFSSLTDVVVAEMMLGHSLKGMQGVYDRHLYLDEQATAYKKWWDRLMEIVAEPPKRQ